jgi:hypothetical protein
MASPLPGAGVPNPLCASTSLQETDSSENARSIGIFITFGKFRIIDLGDLTWNKEFELVCPENKLGTVDVYLATHHGTASSGGPEIVHALQPRVAIIGNGATKGASPDAWNIIHSSPGLQDIWQLHYAVTGGPEHNAPPAFIANPESQPASDKGYALKLSADSNGQFSITNERTGETKKYPAAKRNENKPGLN